MTSFDATPILARGTLGFAIHQAQNALAARTGKRWRRSIARHGFRGRRGALPVPERIAQLAAKMLLIRAAGTIKVARAWLGGWREA